MNAFRMGKSAGWIQGPNYPDGGFGKFAFRPLSKISLIGNLSAAGRAFSFGYSAGKIADKLFGISDKISNYAANRTSATTKWYIHKHF